MAILNMIGKTIKEIVVVKDRLCFTANTAGSTVQLVKNGSPTSVNLEISTDYGNNWNNYSFGDTINLTNIGDRVYFRNKSETDTGFTTGSLSSDYYRFVMTGSINGSGDIGYLLNKKSTNTVSSKCFTGLFYTCSSLKTCPELPATNLASLCYCYMFCGTGISVPPELPATVLPNDCYQNMFRGCGNLDTLVKLPATTLYDSCYFCMFFNCGKIKLSSTQTGDYQTAYRIPTSGTGTSSGSPFNFMFQGTGGTFTGNPTINTTYYTSNTVV